MDEDWGCRLVRLLGCFESSIETCATVMKFRGRFLVKCRHAARM